MTTTAAILTAARVAHPCRAVYNQEVTRPSLALALFALLAASAASGCKVKDPPPITEQWTETFDRASIGTNYYKTGGSYRVVDGALSTKGAFNHPLWLRKTLPKAVVVEIDAWSNSPDGDIKIELFGDGRSHARDRGQYTSSGYVFVMGGWSNTKSLIAKGNEHGKELVSRTTPKVEIGKRYHWKIVRQGTKITWYVDDMETPFLTLEDPAPYDGAAHAYLGFNNWESDSWFDNLVIRPL